MSAEFEGLTPKRVAELIRIVGFDTAMLLVKRYGGTHLNIPKKAKEQHSLVSTIGFAAFRKLCDYYGGTQLEIDLCAHIINQQKQQLILNGVAAGKTNAQLAREFNTTERQIRRIKERTRYLRLINLDIFKDLA